MNEPVDKDGTAYRVIRRLIDVQPAELRALAWAWLYIFSVLFSYYILRPIRDEMGVAGGVENLQWLFTGTLLGMIAFNPPFAALVARLPRVKFIAVTYRFFLANLLLFAILLHFATAAQNLWIGRIFFIWASIFNLFVVSVFWALVVDVFNAEQGKRLFGFIAAGATVGGIVGSSLTATVAKEVPATALLLVSALLLEAAVFCVRRLSRLSDTLQRKPEERIEEKPIGGSVLAGLKHALSSPYLIQVSLYIVLFAVTSTFLYFQQAEIARQSFADRGARTAFFARVDLWVNVLTLGAQVFLTARILRWMGVAVTLGALPLISIVGFGTLAILPTIGVLVAYQVIRGAGHIAFCRPAPAVVFTVVPREDKYKAKSFIDTVVYRLGDQIGAWSYAGLGFLGIAIAGIAWTAVPLSLIWLGNAVWLGRKQKSLESRVEPEALKANVAAGR